MELDQGLFQHLSRLRFRTRTQASGTQRGDRRSRTAGSGVEFTDYREYAPGDDLRLVDWTAYGRLEALLVRLFHEDRNAKVRICLDATASMGFGTPRKLDHAGTLAAGLALIGLMHRDQVDLTCFGGVPARAGAKGQDMSAFPAVLDLLGRVEVGGDGDARHALLAQAGGVRSDRAFLVSDLLVTDDVLDATLQALASSTREAVVVHVLGSDELTPHFRDSALFVDAENGSEVEILTTDETAGAYAEALADWFSMVRARCAARQISWIPAFTTTTARTVFLDALRRSGVLEGTAGSA